MRSRRTKTDPTATARDGTRPRSAKGEEQVDPLVRQKGRAPEWRIAKGDQSRKHGQRIQEEGECRRLAER